MSGMLDTSKRVYGTGTLDCRCTRFAIFGHLFFSSDCPNSGEISLVAENQHKNRGREPRSNVSKQKRSDGKPCFERKCFAFLKINE